MRGHTNFSTAIWSAATTVLSLLQRLCSVTPKLISVCRQINTFPELKVCREFSDSFFKTRTMLVCDWLWYFTHHPSWVILAMGNTWKTKSFHPLLKIVCTDEIQLLMRKTLSKTSYAPFEIGPHEHTGAFIELMIWEEDKFVCPPIHF